jgi:hypothetical protein
MYMPRGFRLSPARVYGPGQAVPPPTLTGISEKCLTSTSLWINKFDIIFYSEMSYIGPLADSLPRLGVR